MGAALLRFSREHPVRCSSEGPQGVKPQLHTVVINLILFFGVGLPPPLSPTIVSWYHLPTEVTLMQAPVSHSAFRETQAKATPHFMT